MKKIVFTIFLAAFFLLRPFSLQDTGGWYPNDDYDYFAQASFLSFGQFPSYKNEFFTNLKEGPMGAIGSGMLAAPFVFMFSLLDRVEHSSIVEQRTVDNVPKSWSQFGFIFASIFYFSVACLLLFRGAALLVGPVFASWAVILMVICQGMPLFAFRRPIFSQIPEFFLQSVFVYLFIRNEVSCGAFIRKWWTYVLLGIGAALIFLTRNNNIMFALIWPLLFIGRYVEDRGLHRFLRRLCCVFIPFILMVMIFKILPEAYNHYTPYSNAFGNMLVGAPWQDILQRLVHIFIGIDWGLIFTAPFFIFGLLGLFFIKMPFKRRLLFASTPLLVNFFVIVFFGSQGGWYGYRYFIASAFPLFVIPLAFLLQWLDERVGIWWKWGSLLILLMPLMSMWCFEHPGLYLGVIQQSFGRSDYGHATYQGVVWQTVTTPSKFFWVIYQGGISYLHYLYYIINHHFGFPAKTWIYNFLPIDKKINLVLLPFEIKILVRTTIIYLMPFGIGWIFRKWTSALK